MSTSIVALVNFALLMILMRRKLGRIGGRHLSRTFGKICLASFVMAVVVWLVNWQVGVQLPQFLFPLPNARGARARRGHRVRRRQILESPQASLGRTRVTRRE
jgi:hypothetical protein